MSANENHNKEEIHSRILRAGRRTYFFDVRATKADDYYLTITESKKHTSENGSSYYKKHKIYLYKEDFERFKDLLSEVTEYIFDKKGEEVISDTHQPDFQSNGYAHNGEEEKDDDKVSPAGAYTDVKFEDI